MNNSKVLVTGATGLTGSHTVQLLLDHGRPVRVLAHREDQRSKRLQDLGAEVTIGDLLIRVNADAETVTGDILYVDGGLTAV